MVTTPHLLARLGALGLVGVIVQVSAVSQFAVFGTNADLTPLIVASAAILLGSLPGACVGFAVGLFLDLALVQTVGLSSLLYLAIGYWAGRLRELRDPQAALIPMAVGAAATAIATIGYSLMQFLLGVEAPVGLVLAREILAAIVLNGLIALPVHVLVPLAGARDARGSAPAPAPRLHDRRPVAAEPRMIEPGSDRRPPITPQLALRVAVLGIFAFALFGIVFFRLWYLQVLSGDQYLQQARDNRVREVRVAAPRGAIVDANGRELVVNRVATVVQLDPESLPEAEREAAATWGQAMTARAKRPKGRRGAPIPIPAVASAQVRARYRRLAGALDMSPRTIQERVVRSLVLVPYANIKVKTDVPATARDFLLERADQYPGIEVAKVYLRDYPEGRMAAQVIGTTGEVSDDELKLDRFRDVTQGTIVGKDGVERTYDRYLRGVDGAQRITVDALGRPKNQSPARPVSPGRQLRTSLDLDLQRTGEDSLQRVIAGGPGTAGAFVALDYTDGRVLAMGSAPTYDPDTLSRPLTQVQFDQQFGEGAGSPLVNRAIAGLYPIGSTFKPITALAGLGEGLITRSTPINDPGCIEIGAEKREFCNAGKEPHGVVALPRALQVSSDVFFYTLGRDLNPLSDQPLQNWARRLGLGDKTRIDILGEAAGTVPDAAWRDRVNRLEARCRKRERRACGIADGENRPWTVGDNVNLSVGQGDVQATPLQMAVAYAALANGGRIVRPHLGVAVEDANSREIARIEPRLRRLGKVTIDPVAREAVMTGLRLATVADGTSADVFRDWNRRAFPIHGKTGTAERPPHGDQSWYVAFVPHERRPIVIAVTVEDGGFGAEAAAPVTCKMLARWFGQEDTCVAGKSKTN